MLPFQAKAYSSAATKLYFMSSTAMGGMRLPETDAVNIGRRSVFALAAATIAAFTGRHTLAQSAEKAGSKVDKAISLPSREIPPPRSVSRQAQEYLAQLGAQPYQTLPALGDTAAWKRSIATQDERTAQMADIVLKIPGVTVETRTVAGVTVHVATASGPAKPHMFIHGGGWTSLGGKLAMMMAKVQALQLGGVVHGVDYRMAPDHRQSCCPGISGGTRRRSLWRGIARHA